MTSEWRTKRYGRIEGGQIEKCLEIFRAVWSEYGAWSQALQNDDEWLGAFEKIAVVPNWVNFYQDSFIQLLAKTAFVAGFSEQLIAAARCENPISKILDLTDETPESAPEHPASLPMAFAMLGNLTAIARYSRSINDMIVACREKRDIQSLFDALSIDSYIVSMPFFLTNLRIGQLARNKEFAEAVFGAIAGPHAHRLEYAELRWVEYLLRDQGAFEACNREEIYDLCVEHLAVYDPSGEKKDAKAALFSRFRAWQREAGIQNPRFGFSAKRQ